jgi:predicted dinucleotide-utilizing enzyme
LKCKISKKYRNNLYLISAFDLFAGFLNEKGVRALRRSPFYTPEMETDNKVVFLGTAREAIATFPTGTLQNIDSPIVF